MNITKKLVNVRSLVMKKGFNSKVMSGTTKTNKILSLMRVFTSGQFSGRKFSRSSRQLNFIDKVTANCLFPLYSNVNYIVVSMLIIK